MWCTLFPLGVQFTYLRVGNTYHLMGRWSALQSTIWNLQRPFKITKRLSALQGLDSSCISLQQQLANCCAAKMHAGRPPYPPTRGNLFAVDRPRLCKTWAAGHKMKVVRSRNTVKEVGKDFSSCLYFFLLKSHIHRRRCTQWKTKRSGAGKGGWG